MANSPITAPMGTLSNLALLNSNPKESHNRVSVFEEDAKKLKEKTSNTLYQQVAKNLGITNFNSWNDVKQVEDYLAKSGGGSSNSSNSSTTNGANYSSSSSIGGSGRSGSSGSRSGGSGGGSGGGGSTQGIEGQLGQLSDQQKAGQDAAADQIARAKDLNALYADLMMTNKSSSLNMVDLMNYQAGQTALGQQQMQQQMQMMAMQSQAQFMQSQMQAQAQQIAMQKQVEAMMASVAEQTRMASNMAKAYVPDVKKTAGFTPVGDLRTGMERSSSKLSELRDLAMLPGTPATGTNPSLKNALVVA